MKKIISISLCLFFYVTGQSQNVINESFSAEGMTHFIISNFSGDIKVSQGSSNQIKVTSTLVNGELDENIHVDIKKDKDYLMIYLRMPCTKDESDIQFDPAHPTNISYQKNNCDWKMKKIKRMPSIEYQIELPKNIHLYVSNIMESSIEISNIQNDVWANNINGNIEISQAVKVHMAKTINGDINISFKEKPSIDATYSTINGDVNINVPLGIQTTTSFKTFNGDFYTDIESITMLPSNLIEETTEESFKYKVENKRRMNINGGGIQMDFETFNGNVYLTSKN